jgi:hypothetical protein
MRPTGRSAAIGTNANHRTPRCIQGAFLAYFLCTSKESESAAGPKPSPAMHAYTRQTNREAHGADSKHGQEANADCYRYCQLNAAKSLTNSGMSFHNPLRRALATVIQVGWYRYAATASRATSA